VRDRHLGGRLAVLRRGFFLGWAEISFVHLLTVPPGKPTVTILAAVGIWTIGARDPTRMRVHALAVRIVRTDTVLDHDGTFQPIDMEP
jgi:hypothetical protein